VNGIVGQEDTVQADEGEDFHHARRCVEDGEVVPGLTGFAIECGESGNAGCVDAFDAVKIEREALFAHMRRQTIDQAAIAPADKLGEPGNFGQFDFPG
jgi:hypothetical protein